MLGTMQIILLTLISLLGIPAGFLLKKITMEEMKAGRRWFRIISVLSLISAIVSITLINENSALYASTLMFIFFISSVPLIKKNKKRIH